MPLQPRGSRPGVAPDEAEHLVKIIKTWKSSRDPQFSEKMARILDLYDHSAAGQIPDGAG